MLDLEPSPSTYTTGTFPILPSHRSIYIISLHSRSREKRAGPFISPPPVRLTALATILRRLLLAAHTPPPLVRGRLVLRAAAATPAIGSCAVKLAGLTPFSSTGKGGGGGGGGGRWSNRAPGQQRHHRQQRLPKPRPDQHREQRQQWRPNPAQRPTTNMTTAEEAHKMGVGVGQKRDAAEPADPAGEGAADNAAAAAEAAREVQRKARDESHSKRMKRLLQTDPAAAERMEYRRRVGICCRDQDMAEAIRCVLCCAVLCC